MTIRLIRSKGVGVFFITQNPCDVPSSILSQLAGRVQHALRAFTPQEQRVVKTIAQTFRANPDFDTEEAIMSLGTGEALLSFLQADGAPSITQKAVMLPPASQIGSITDSLRTALMEASDIKGKYDNAFDRESAYEVLSRRFAAQGVSASNVLVSVAQEVVDAVEALPRVAKAAFKVFDPASGMYVEQAADEEEPVTYAPPTYEQPPQNYQQPQQMVPAQPRSITPQEAPPVLVFNRATGQYEPQQQVKDLKPAAQPKAKAEKPVKKEKGLAEKMLDNFTRSTASGAGYTVGRSLSRGILGIFGMK